MAPLPIKFSTISHPITVAISEGRAEEAMHMLVHALRTEDDKATRHLAAEWIETIGLPPGAAKALRKGQKELPDEWLDVSELFESISGKMNYDEAIRETAKRLGYSERHVQKCVAMWREAKEESRDYD